MAKALRKCKFCGLETFDKKGLSLFATDKGMKHNRANTCKECDKERAKKSYIKRDYNVTVEEYTEAMNTSVTCEICGFGDNLHYDHNHETSSFRGVLCGSCNRGLGLFKDSPTLLTRATNYLLERGYYG